MASNPFEKFVTPPPEENPFNRFVETPIDRALQAREEDVLDYQAGRQEDYERQQAYAKELLRQHPDLAGPSSMQEAAPALDPYLLHREPQIAPREAASKQELGSGFSASLKLGLLEDTETKRRVLAETLFPGDPDGIYRVGFDASGMPVYVGDDGKLHKIASGTARFGAQLLADSPEMLGAAVGAPAGLGGAAVVAGSAHLLKRKIAGALLGEPYSPESLLRSTARETAMAGLGEAAGRGLAVLGNRGRTIDFAPEDMAKAEALRERVKAMTGVDLDLAQASGDRRLIALRAYVARYPGPSANLVEAAEEAQKGQFHEAAERVLDNIAKATPAEVAGKEGINAAQTAIDLTRRAAQRRVDPLYQRAYAQAPAVMDPNVIRFFRHKEFREAYRKGQDIARLEEEAAPTVVVTTTRRVPDVELPPMSVNEVPQMSVREVPTPPAERVKPPGLTADQRRLPYEAPSPGTDLVPAGSSSSRDLVVNAQGNIVPRQQKFEREKTQSGFYRWKEIIDQEEMKVPDLRALDYTKRGLDRMIESLKAEGKRQEAAALSWQRRKFVKALDDLDVPEYRAARAAWKKELNENIRPLENGVVGVLSRIKEPNANKAAARLFSDANLTPTMVQTAKTAIQKESPDEWNQLARSWIAFKWNQAQRVTRTSTDINSPGAFHQMLFGTPTARENTIALLDKPSAEALEGVMEAAAAMKRTPTAGSNTFRDLETKEIFEGLTGPGYRVVQALTSPRYAMRRWAERRAVEQSTLAVAQGILDPTMRHKLRVVLRMRPSTQRNILLFNVIGTQLAKDYVKARLGEGENTELVAGEEGAIGE